MINFICKKKQMLTSEQKRILELEDENRQLKATVASLKADVASLTDLVHQLLQEIDRLKHLKNSRNSSVPPSKDENRPFKTNSLRKADGKKPGGQTGHEGNTLKMSETPDSLVDHKPTFCNICGNDISNNPMEISMRRQVVDIPPILPKYIEHRVFKTFCSCGHQTESSFPQGINATVSYGPNIEATIAYMHTRQYIPFERMGEYFRDVCNLPISQGAICNILERFAIKAYPAYQLIATKVENSNVVGADETGAKVNGKTGWFWTWQSKLATFITFSNNRGTATINDNFKNGFENAVLVHDCWRSHFETKVQTHQLCIAHLLRELVFLEEHYKHPWPIMFKQLLYDALELKKQLSESDYYYPINQRTELNQRLLLLLQKPVDESLKELFAFQKRINKYKDYIFTFLYHHQVPPDNNASERAIRNIKVKQKVSGQFKTQRGAEIYAIIRSITDTCNKNEQNILSAFSTIAKLQPE
jgi:transposase